MFGKERWSRRLFEGLGRIRTGFQGKSKSPGRRASAPANRKRAAREQKAFGRRLWFKSQGEALEFRALLAITVHDDVFRVTHDQPLDTVSGALFQNDEFGPIDPSNPPSAVLVEAPAHGSVTLNADGGFAYTPIAGFVGADTFSYRVTLGVEESDPGAVQIEVSNQTPTAFANLYTLEANTSLTLGGDLPTGGFDADGDPLVVALVSQPAHGALTTNEDGSVTYVVRPEILARMAC